MAKQSKEEKKSLKLNIQNKQIAKAVNLKGIKEKLSKKKASEPKETPSKKAKEAPVPPEAKPEEAPRIKARSKSAFAEEAQKSDQEKASTSQKKKEAKAAQVKMKEPAAAPKEKLGPTGKHISDILPPKKEKPKKEENEEKAASEKVKPKFKETPPPRGEKEEDKKKAGTKKAAKGSKFREFRDMKSRPFDARDRAGLRAGEETFYRYRKRKPKPSKQEIEETTVRPANLKLRLPISVKDLASEMKRKASELIAQLFKHGVLITINDILDDETTIQILGEDLGCKIEIDTSEEERIRITDKSIQEEIKESDSKVLKERAPVVTFMGHVDHGKTSLIDKIRETDVAAGEAGAITQHIGAFLCHTDLGNIAILDTPGHEAFSAMRHRGANVTDIVVLVIAGDEGFRQQTEEALQQAREAGVAIVVALNKCDKPNFDADKVYRQLSEHELLPEAWGGQTVTINCSAATGEGVKELVEMLALQAEVMELKANPEMRARGTVLESEMHKGLGSVATVLVQNGTLKQGDAFVVDRYYGRVKIMHDEHGKNILQAGPSTPVEITGLSGIPEAGSEFVVVDNEKEARDIAEMRSEIVRQKSMQRRAPSLESMMEQAQEQEKKEFNLMICADVQGSLEALDNALKKIKSDKVRLNIISKDIGEVSESNIHRAAASNATILGFHTAIESHAEPLLKQLSVVAKLHDIIYHAIDDVKELMRQTLDKIPVENDRGQAEVRQTFRASHLGVIAGCYVTEGMINRNHQIRVIRDGEEIWKGPMSSLKRVKEDVREVQKGLECGILLKGFNEVQEGDILEAFEISYIEQDL